MIEYKPRGEKKPEFNKESDLTLAQERELATRIRTTIKDRESAGLPTSPVQLLGWWRKDVFTVRIGGEEDGQDYDFYVGNG